MFGLLDISLSFLGNGGIFLGNTKYKRESHLLRGNRQRMGLGDIFMLQCFKLHEKLQIWMLAGFNKVLFYPFPCYMIITPSL